MQSILREFSKVLTELFFRAKEAMELVRSISTVLLLSRVKEDICILRSFSQVILLFRVKEAMEDTLRSFSKVLLFRVEEDMGATGKAKGLVTSRMLTFSVAMQC